MYNVKNIGKESYVPAEAVIEQSWPEKLSFGFWLFCDVFKTLGLTFLVMLKSVIGMFSRSSPKSIDGKLALVTGGANGLGRLIAMRLASERCHVIITDLDAVAAKRTASEIRKAYGVKCEDFCVDMTDYDAVENLRVQIKQKLGIVDILINNVGVIPYVSLREKHWTDIDRILKVNVTPHFWATRVFLDDMIKQKDGHIVAIASMAGLITGPFMITYSAAKHAVIGFMGCLTDELVVEGHGDYIKTTTICPYFINTRKDFIDFVNLRFPPLEPEDVANKVVDAMLHDEEFLMIMNMLWLAKCAIYLPNSIQRIVSDVLFKTKTIRNLKTE